MFFAITLIAAAIVLLGWHAVYTMKDEAFEAHATTAMNTMFVITLIYSIGEAAIMIFVPDMLPSGWGMLLYLAMVTAFVFKMKSVITHTINRFAAIKPVKTDANSDTTDKDQ